MIRTICVAIAMTMAGFQASAATMKAEYTGTVPAAYSYDSTGIFNDAGTSFNGAGFTLSYIATVAS